MTRYPNYGPSAWPRQCVGEVSALLQVLSGILPRNPITRRRTRLLDPQFYPAQAVVTTSTFENLLAPDAHGAAGSFNTHRPTIRAAV